MLKNHLFNNYFKFIKCISVSILTHSHSSTKIKTYKNMKLFNQSINELKWNFKYN